MFGFDLNNLGGLTSHFGQYAEGAGNIVQDNPRLTGVGAAIAMGYADGDENILMSGLKGIFDYMAVSDAADGEVGTLSKIYLAFRGASIGSHQTGGSTLAWVGSGASTYLGLNQWENANKPPAPGQ